MRRSLVRGAIRQWFPALVVWCCTPLLFMGPSAAYNDDGHILCGPQTFENCDPNWPNWPDPRHFSLHCSGIAHARGRKSVEGGNCVTGDDCAWGEYGQRGDYSFDWEGDVEAEHKITVKGFLTATCNEDEACEDHQEAGWECVEVTCPYDGTDWNEIVDDCG